MTFEEALDFTLKEEGGYANHPADRGGPTNFGIVQKTYDGYRYRKGLPPLSVKFIESYEVVEIYRKQYWVDGRCDLIAELNPKLAAAHFDACVNHGIRNAAKLLQRALKVEADGIIGSKTLASVKLADVFTLRKLLEIREDFYISIVSSNNSQIVFLRTWIHRVRRLRKRLKLC